MRKLLIAFTILGVSASAGTIGTYDVSPGNVYNAYNSTTGPSACTGPTVNLCGLYLDGTAGLQSILVALPVGVTYGDVVFTTDIANTTDTTAWIYELIFPNDGAGSSDHVQLVSNLSPLFQGLSQVEQVPNAFVAGTGGLTATTPEPSTFVLVLGLGLMGVILHKAKNGGTGHQMVSQR